MNPPEGTSKITGQAQDPRKSGQLAIIIALGAFGSLGFALTSPILPELATALGVSESAIGLVQSALRYRGFRSPWSSAISPTAWVVGE